MQCHVQLNTEGEGNGKVGAAAAAMDERTDGRAGGCKRRRTDVAKKVSLVHSLLRPGPGRHGAVGGPQRRLLGRVVLLLLLLQGGHLLRLPQRVHGDGQEDVEQRVVAEQRQEDEVQRVDEAGARPALRLDAL